MPGTNNESPDPKLSLEASPSQIAEWIAFHELGWKDQHEVVRAAFSAGYNAGVTAVVADLPKPKESEGTHIYTGRAVGKDSTGYYHPRWDKAKDVQVQADTWEEAYEKMVVALGPHPQFAISRVSGKPGYSGWIVNWDKIEVAP